VEPVTELPAPRRPDGARAIWRAKWWILLAAIVAGGAAYGACKLMQETFRSSTIVRVSVAPGSSSQDAIGASNDLSQQYAQLVTSDAVVRRAAAKLKVPAGDLSGQVSSGTVQDQNLVRIEASAHTAPVAIARTEAVADAFRAVVTESNQRQARQYRRTLERPLKPLNDNIESLRESIRNASTQERADNLRASLNDLITERTRQQATIDQSVAAVLPAIDPVSRASAASQVQPRPKLYTIGAALIAALVAAQIAVAIRRPSY
jgi:capsular polysaccharide biosynthesis protein